MNTVGNYTPRLVNNNVRQTKSKETSGQVEAGSTLQKKTDNLTSDEKDFFMKLYPQNKLEVADYHFYQRSGKMSGVKIGSMFDKKG